MIKQGARRFKQNKARERAALLEKKLLQARADFEAIKTSLIECHSPRRIYQWGSLIHSEHFSGISDIDIAVEGITEPSEMSDFPIDLVRLEWRSGIVAPWRAYSAEKSHLFRK